MSEEKDRVALGARLKDAREYRGFSQEEVASYLGISRSAISLIETGVRGLDFLELKKLAKLYKCTIEELSGEKNEIFGDTESVRLVARATSALTKEDQDEVLRFAQFLSSRKPGKKHD